MRILLVEDDPVFGDGLAVGLGLSGHVVDWLTDGREAIGALAGDRFSVAILDLALPGASGLAVLSAWRRDPERHLPVLVLTAGADDEGCIAALDGGAVDYLAKPVDLGVLEARLRALVRRCGGHADNALACGSLSLERGTRTVRLNLMDRLVDQLLALARVDLGLADVPKRRVDLVVLAAEATAAHERIAEAAGVELRAAGGRSGAVVLGNATLLRSMVSNLLDNAIKFSPRRGTVDVSATVRGSLVEVRVRDRGPGVQTIERERAFEPFRRSDDERRRGSGLGPTTVRAIARAHGGEARLDASPGGGTDAVVTLPVADAVRAP